MNYLRTECHLAENTVAAYGRDLRRFDGWLGERDFRTLTIRDLADYAGFLHEQKLAAASTARHLVSLKLFYRYLQLEGVVKDNLVELLGSQKLWQRVPQVLGPATIDRMFAAPTPRDGLWRRDRAMLELLYATGCRASELSNLTRGDLHLDEAYAVCHGKGDKQRIVPLGGRAIEAVRDYFDAERAKIVEPLETDPPWVLLSRRGLRLRRERMWELVKRYALRAGAGGYQPAFAKT